VELQEINLAKFTEVKTMITPKHDYEGLGSELGKLIAEKQLAYGDSYGKSGEVLKQLFPNGIPMESYTDALAIVRIVDKLFRVATDPTWGGESPWKDIAGYALLRFADVEGHCYQQPDDDYFEERNACPASMCKGGR
jgi:hypothetical protein